MFSIKSLRVKTLLWALIPTAIVMVAAGIIALYAYEQVARDVVQERDTELARISAARLSEGLSRYSQVLKSTAADVQSMETDHLDSALKEAQNHFYVFDAGVVVYDSEGVALWSQPFVAERQGTDCPVPSEFRKVSDTRQPAFSNVFKDEISGEDVILIGVPIIGSDDEVNGILAGMATLRYSLLSTTYAEVLEITAGYSGYAYLVDGNGRVIYHRHSSLLGTNLADTEPVMRATTSAEPGAVLTEDATGEIVISGFAPVPGTGWGLITQERWEEVVGPIRGYNTLLLGLLVVGGLLSVALVFFSIGRVLRPIQDLTRGAQRIAGGDFDYAIAAKTGDEIQALAQQFNTMASALKESYSDLEWRVAERTKELATLNAVAQTVSRSLELEAMLTATLDKVLEALEFESGAIYLKDLKTDELQMSCHHGLSDTFRRVVAQGMISARVAESGNPIIIDDLPKEPDAPKEVVEEGYLSVASIPLVSKGQVQGVLTAASRQLRRFRQQDVDLLLSIGHQIGVGIENARLFEAEQRRAEEFRVISKVGRRMTSILAIDELLGQIARLIQETLGYPRVSIGLIEGDELVCKASVGPGWDPPWGQLMRLKVGREGVTGWVASTGEPLLVPDVSQEPRFVPTSVLPPSRSALAVPLRTKEAVIGVLNVESDRLDAFDDSDVAVLQSLGNQAAVAIENASFFKAEQRRAEQFRVISEVGRHITSILDVDELLGEIVRLLKDTFGYYLITIGLIEGEEVVFKAGAKTHWDAPQFIPPPVKVGGKGITAWVAATGEPLLAPDVSQEPRFLFLPDTAETRSELAVPLKTKTAVIGVLDVESNQLNAFDESDLVVLQSLANQAAIAIDNARLFAERERRIDEMAVLNEVGRAISSTLRLDQLMDLIHRQVSRVMDTSNLYIALYDRDEDWVSFPLYVEGGQVRRGGRGRNAGQGLTEYIIRSRQPLLLPDELEGRMQELGIKVIGTPAKSWLGVPMIAGDEVLGVIAVQSYTTENVYDEEHLNLLPTIAAQAAIAIENARLYEQAQQLAVMEERQRLGRELHDAVTQTLFSASLIAEALPTIWESDQDEGQQLLQDLQQLSRGALAEMRTLLTELRPAALVEANMADLLRQLGEAVAGRMGVPVTVTVEDQHELPPDVHVALYRIAQEALNNVVKHARASQVAVSLRGLLTPPMIGGVELHITDNGRGFDPSCVPSDHLGLGLGIIRERAEAIGATLNIESQPGHGTQVIVVWERKTR